MTGSGLSDGLVSGIGGALAIGWPVVVSMVTGWSIVGAVVGPGGLMRWADRVNSGGRDGGGVMLRVGLGGLVGLWFGSMVMVAVRYLWIGAGQSAGVVAELDILLMALAVIAASWRGGLRGSLLGEKGRPAAMLLRLRERLRASLEVWLLRLAVLAGCVLTLVHARGAYLEGPYGAFDAIAIWNTKARFLADEQLWQHVFSPKIPWTHPDYPLLLPLNLARLWSYTSLCGLGQPAWCGLVLGLVYLTLALMIVGGAVSLMVSSQREASESSDRRGEAWGLVAALAVLGSPGVQAAAVSQMADLPVGVALAGAVACGVMAIPCSQTASKNTLASNDRVTSRWLGLGWASLAGLLAGAAAWTKNEGLLMALAVGVGLLLVSVVLPLLKAVRGGRSVDKAISYRGLWIVMAFVLAFVPTGLVLMGIKLSLAPPTDLIQNQSASGLSRLLDPMRHLQILVGFGHAAIIAIGWPLLLAGLATLVIALRSPRQLAGPGILVGVILAVILAGECVVYLLTPHDLAWHLATSADRLVLQLWPTIVLGLALATSQGVRPVSKGSAGGSGSPPSPGGE